MTTLHVGYADVLVLYALFCAGWGLVRALRGREPNRSLVAACVVFTLGGITQGALGVALLARDERAAEPDAHVMYGVLAVIVLPLALLGSRRASARFASVIVAAAAAFTAAIVARAVATGG